MSIKGRLSKGNILTKYNVRKIEQRSIGESTLGGRDIFLDEDIGKLNSEKRGTYLGSFNSEDRIIVFYKDGTYEMTSFNFSFDTSITFCSIITPETIAPFASCNCRISC